MTSFFKTLVPLVAALLLLASAVNATLERLGASPAENSFTWCDGKGAVVLAYDGPQALEQKLSPQPAPLAAPLIIHRT